MIASDGGIKCDVCGRIAYSTRDLNVTVDSRKGAHAGYYKTHMNVCNQCLPNILIMLELAMIKTSQLMVEVNRSVVQ